VNLLCPPPPPPHTSTFTAAGNSVGWVGEGGSPSSLPHTLTLPTQLQQNSYKKLYRIQNAEYGIQNTVYGIQNTENRIQKLMYIKLPMYGTCFVIWRLDLMILMPENPLPRPLEVGPENLDFFGAKWHWLRSLPFQGPPLPTALESDFPALKSLRPPPYKQQVH
jgi:hypothetical protein